ncbi:MAG: hypothetical protein ACR2L1_11355 [Pyrinomonadaceae bacterium]
MSKISYDQQVETGAARERVKRSIFNTLPCGRVSAFGFSDLN